MKNIKKTFIFVLPLLIIFTIFLMRGTIMKNPNISEKVDQKKLSHQFSDKADSEQNNSARDSNKEDGFTWDAPELNEADYVIKVNLSKQRVFIYHKGKEIRQMICSSGLLSDDNETPKGRFIINESGLKKGEWFFSERFNAGAKYWVGFIGGEYLFHSLPMDRNKSLFKDEAALLGKPASHGCIRLSVDDAYWFYTTIPAGSVLYISGTTEREVKSISIEPREISEKEAHSIVLNEPLLTKRDVSTWLFAHEYEYYQQHLLSCEVALIRMTLAIMGVENLDEQSIIDSLPKGKDPEISFVCDDIDQGRRLNGTIFWDNYGAHPPVVVQELNTYMDRYGLSDIYTVKEMTLSDEELINMVDLDDEFLGAIVWLIGHPARWGDHPPVNDRGIVLGEHVRFVNPELDEEGKFMIWDPESHPYQPYHLSSLPSRDMFDFRLVGIFRSTN